MKNKDVKEREEWEHKRQLIKEQKQQEELKKKQGTDPKNKKGQAQAQPQARGQRLVTNTVKAVAAPALFNKISTRNLEERIKQRLNPANEARERKLNERSRH